MERGFDGGRGAKIMKKPRHRLKHLDEKGASGICHDM